MVDLKGGTSKLKRLFVCRRVLPKIILSREVWIEEDGTHISYYKIIEEKGIYNCRVLKKITNHIYITTNRCIAYGILPSNIKPLVNCKWVVCDYDYADDLWTYETSCGTEFALDGDEEESGDYNFCPHCGKRIVLIKRKG